MAKKLSKADIEFSIRHLEYQRGWYDDPDWHTKIDSMIEEYRKKLEKAE